MRLLTAAKPKPAANVPYLLRRENLHAIVVMVDHDDVVAGRIDRHAVGTVELPIRRYRTMPNWLRYTPAELNICTRLLP